jgi:hypothetical protein
MKEKEKQINKEFKQEIQYSSLTSFILNFFVVSNCLQMAHINSNTIGITLIP